MSSDEDDFASYGNALDPIDEDSIPRKKPITAEDQYAKDERGRRRFHGAFTGGFSAGFFNSVGSVEGWRPANFVSSRTNRTRTKGQSIFDFMDEEDTGEYGICPMSLQVKPTFDAKSSKVDPSNSKKRSRNATNEQQHSILDTSFVREMLAPTRDTVGVKLLVKMGWRPGQGVGPRVSKRERKLHKRQRQRQTGDSKKTYGCRLPTESGAVDSESDSDANASDSEPEFEGDLDDLTFAPNDYQAYVANPKQNSFGLGYQGIDRKPVLSSARPELSTLTVAGKSIRGQAFGVSVFEDDDDDIYNTDDMSNYDFSLPCVGEAKPAQRKPTSPKNTNCIEGFYVSTRTASKTRQPFALPSIPKDFQPLRVKKNRWDCRTTSSGDVRKTRISRASERCEILGDDQNENASGSGGIRISDIPLPESTSSEQKKTQETPTKSALPVQVGCVRPFAYDEQKQYRYEKFLSLKNSSQSLEMTRIYPASMTEWEKEREKSEFEQAARLYQPLAEDLACRFTRSSQNEDVHDISAPVEPSYDAETQALRNAAKNKMYGALTRKKYSWKPDKVICKRFNIPEPFDNSRGDVSERVPKTRESKGSLFEFLKMSTSNTVASRSADDTVSSCSRSRSRSQSPRPAPNRQTESNVSDQPSTTQKANENASNTGAADEDSENDEQIKNITDKIDLFKAIFLSSSDDESEDEAKRQDEDQSKKREKSESTTAFSESQRERNIDTETETTTTLRRDNKREIRYSPARGIFANLDLESLKCKPSFRKNEHSGESVAAAAPPAASVAAKPRVDDSSSETNANAELLYGPKIPNSLLSKTVAKNDEKAQRFQHHRSGEASEISSQQQSRRTSSPVWVEKSGKHKNKKHKKHRKKQKKKKSKKEK